MTTHETPPPAAERRPWVEPLLTRHSSMTAMTQQYDVPLPGPDEALAVDSAMRALDVPGSQGFFP